MKPVTDRILSLENAAEPTPLAECDLEQFYPALEVTLSDTETLRGKPLPANLTLVVGIEANERWDSPPRLNPATNEIYFPGTPSAFAKGARVGASLFEEPSTGELLTLTTPLFSVEPGNVVEFAATGPCIPSPPGLNRIPLSAFRNELGNVQATAAAQSEADDLRDALGMALPTDAMAEKHLASKCLPTDHVEPVQEKDPEEEGGLAF